MKTYLLVADNECQRCNNRWTTSYVCNHWASIVSPFLKVNTIAGFFHQNNKHQACFACIEREAIALPLPHAQKNYELATPAPKVEIDILGD